MVMKFSAFSSELENSNSCSGDSCENTSGKDSSSDGARSIMAIIGDMLYGNDACLPIGVGRFSTGDGTGLGTTSTANRANGCLNAVIPVTTSASEAEPLSGVRGGNNSHQSVGVTKTSGL